MFHPTAAVQIRDNRLEVSHDMGAAGIALEHVDLCFNWTLADTCTAVQPYIMYGQSLALNLGHDQPLTKDPVAPGRAMMYANPGAGAQMSVSERPGWDTADFGPCHFPATDLDRLEDLKEDRGESPVSTAVCAFLPALPATTAVVATNHARGGMHILKLLPKHLAEGRGHGIQYAGLLRAAVRTRQFCAAHDRRMLQPIVSFIQGEAAPPRDADGYHDRLLALQAALTSDLGKVTGLGDQVPVFTDQTRVMWPPTQTLDNVEQPLAMAQLAAALRHPGRLYCVGPKYFLPRRSTRKGRGDAVHLLPEASALLGDYHGRAIWQTLQGRPWLPLHVATYARTGAVIRLGVQGGDGSPLLIDTDMVRQTEASLLGFRWLQLGGTAPTVADLRVNGREITLTLDHDPGQRGQDFTTAALTIGLFAEAKIIDEGPLTGGRTNIRDSCPDVGRYGLPMQNWLCHDCFWDTETGGTRLAGTAWAQKQSLA